VPPGHPNTLPRGGAESLLQDELAEARERTLALVAPVSDEDLDRVHSTLMSPLVWDLGHIGAFEELWIARESGADMLHPELAQLYDAAETPRADRGDLPYLRRHEALEYLDEVRAQTLSLLDPDGFVGELILQHEQQHNETMLQTLKLAEPGVYEPARRPLPTGVAPGPDTVVVEGGPFAMGDPGEDFAYDNERPRREVHVDTFEIDRLPVTNGAYMEFVEDGGERPLYWTEDGRVRDFERTEPLDPALPVAHVSWSEADAYARWRGARLPTEAEWEKAAAFDPATGESRRLPWGNEPPAEQHANLDQLGFEPAAAGAYPAGASACGALGMVGDLWEWTASDFAPYPGFHAFPYREYSEVFFGGDYKVLRGGSWATRPRVARCSFRNWDHPIRRQIFAGFRCAWDR
jgi:gamma-glutamyl hercynylcysteine S-oxide synthase